jgi:hypothetical protein
MSNKRQVFGAGTYSVRYCYSIKYVREHKTRIPKISFRLGKEQFDYCMILVDLLVNDK